MSHVQEHRSRSGQGTARKKVRWIFAGPLFAKERARVGIVIMVRSYGETKYARAPEESLVLPCARASLSVLMHCLHGEVWRQAQLLPFRGNCVRASALVF